MVKKSSITHPTHKGIPVKVFQMARFNGKKEDVSSRFAGQEITDADIEHEKKQAWEVMNTDTPVNVYYEVVI